MVLQSGPSSAVAILLMVKFGWLGSVAVTTGVFPIAAVLTYAMSVRYLRLSRLPQDQLGDLASM